MKLASLRKRAELRAIRLAEICRFGKNGLEIGVTRVFRNRPTPVLELQVAELLQQAGRSDKRTGAGRVRKNNRRDLG
jgi:hypothetical protein